MSVFTRDDGYLPLDLLQSGLHHFDAARELLQKDPAHYDSGGYLLHLAIELLLKSWLLQLNNQFDGTHSLGTLRQRIVEAGIKLNLDKSENRVLDHLDRLFDLRYPNRKNPVEIGPDEFQLANRVLEKLWDLMPSELLKALEELPSGSKGDLPGDFRTV